MARSRKVAPEDALNAAVSLFWKHGFSNLGTRQLETETGITRFTLQTIYGGKMKLFQTALDAYLEEFSRSNLLQATREGRDGIIRFFEMRVDPNLFSGPSENGCFMINSMIEFSSENDYINQCRERYLGLLRGGFETGLQRAIDSGDLPPEFDVSRAVELLLSSALGLNLFIRSAASSSAGKNMAYAIAQTVRSWP